MFDLPADVKESAWLIEEASLIWTEVTLDVVAQMDDLSLTALRHLLAAHRHGPLNLSALALHLGMSPSATGRMVDRLVGQELLQRSPATHSRREVRIEVTPRGHEILEQLRTVRRQCIGEALGRLPPEDRRALTRLLQQLTAAAEPPPA
ncbi:MarR family winged helix-turn-helix transcriptional regulator [Nonomuraea typhae]|uniref:MarR family winged helix-turn-helix transcriptional regulator n=1 Tax=Nonomuraea typhae TaxID=2603600 RepID=A0ABW7YP01_9ACTN